MADNASAKAGVTPLTVNMTRNAIDSVDLAAYRLKTTRQGVLNRAAIYYNRLLGLRPGDTLTIESLPPGAYKGRFVRLGRGWPLWWKPVPLLVDIPLWVVWFVLGALVL